GGEASLRARGREVFLDNCAICHSSKQPQGFDLRFERTMAGGWQKAPVPSDYERRVYTLPADYHDWEDFKMSPSYLDYEAAVKALAKSAPASIDARDEFLENNFMSNELRIPVTLVGTYSGRAMATNATQGHVWSDYSSDTYKRLKSVGDVGF